MKAILVESIRTFAPLLFILASAVAFSRVLTLLQIPQQAGEFILSNFHTKLSILLIMNVILLAVGMVMDTSPAILILTPILLPIAQGAGINPIHFGIIMVVNLAIGFVTPPIGINLFVASSLTDIEVFKIKKSIAISSYFPGCFAYSYFGAANILVAGRRLVYEKKIYIYDACSNASFLFWMSNKKQDFAASSQTYPIIIATDSPSDTVTGLFAEKFAQEVIRLSEGKIQMKVYDNGVLGGDRELFRKL